MISTINNDLKALEVMVNGELLAKDARYTIIDRSLKIRELFGLSFDQSFYFNRSQIEPRHGNILGLSSQLLDKF